MPRRRPIVEGTAEHRSRPEERASVDTVLEFLGVVHPEVAPQLLLTFGVLLVSIGALIIGPLLPLPLYSCWGALRQDEVPRRPTCLGRSLLPGFRLTPSDNEWQCSRGALWWSSVTWKAGLLVFVRLLLTVTAGVAMDVYGRRRVTIVAMGTYFSFALSRSFAPSSEVAVTAVVVEGAAAWAAVVALLLIGLECSTQREAVRSLCLPLVGHSLALGGAALIHATLLEERWRQLAKSLPAMAFVVLVWWLPENPRWLTYRGNWMEARMVFPRTHGAPLDDSAMPKLLTVHRETERSLSSIRCSGSIIRRSVMPVLWCRPLLRVLLLCSMCALPYGLTVGVRLRAEPSPYNSLSDRVLAHGCTELMVLLVLPLLLGRAGAGRLLSGAMLTLGTTTALTTVTWDVGLHSCGVDVMLSLASHGGTVAAGVALLLAMWRLCPTHSRGTICGFVWAWALLGYALAGTYSRLLAYLTPSHVTTSIASYSAAGWCLLATLLPLLLPATPSGLPDCVPGVPRKRSHESQLGEVISHEFPSSERTRL